MKYTVEYAYPNGRAATKVVEADNYVLDGPRATFFKQGKPVATYTDVFEIEAEGAAQQRGN